MRSRIQHRHYGTNWSDVWKWEPKEQNLFWRNVNHWIFLSRYLKQKNIMPPSLKLGVFRAKMLISQKFPLHFVIKKHVYTKSFAGINPRGFLLVVLGHRVSRHPPPPTRHPQAPERQIFFWLKLFPEQINFQFQTHLHVKPHLYHRKESTTSIPSTISEMLPQLILNFIK